MPTTHQHHTHRHPTTARPRRVTRASLVAAVTLALAGCEANNRLSIGAPGSSAAWTPPAVAPSAAIADTDGPSIPPTGDRSGWPVVEVLVPNDLVVHGPILTGPWPRLDDATARSRGAYPAAVTALETEGELGPQVAEAVVWPVWVLGDAVLAVPRLATNASDESPIRRYDRGRPAETRDHAPGAPAAAETE